MSLLKQNLIITSTNQKARDLKASSKTQTFDKVLTLDNFIEEEFQKRYFEYLIDDTLGSSIIYKIIQDHNIEYFDYLKSDAATLGIIYKFIVKCNRNEANFDKILSGEKLQAIKAINEAYQDFKSRNSLVDIADVEYRISQESFTELFTQYENVFIDNFTVGNINFLKSSLQQSILDNFSNCTPLPAIKENIEDNSKVIKLATSVFDNVDEVQHAIRLVRKLIEEGESANDIIIVATDIQEYAPIYKLFLNEYAIQGYSSIGTPLSVFHNQSSTLIAEALVQYENKIKILETLYKKIGLPFDTTIKKSIKDSIAILDEKIGIEMTEPNQLVGLTKRYKHIIFIGTDINHFPPPATDNFLYTYEDDIEYFYANNYFTGSQTQLNELKRLADNLYIITASYSGKRELSPSILIGKEYDDLIDISGVQSVSSLALQNKTIKPDAQTQSYYQSLTSQEFTQYDGLDVTGVSVRHLSASQINKYISCPLAYLYSNKMSLRSPSQDEEGFDVMEQGSLMHLCYELFGRYIKENNITSINRNDLCQIMYDVSIKAYEAPETIEGRGEENVHHQLFLNTLQSGLIDERAPGLLAKFVHYYIEHAEDFEYFKNTEFEMQFALDKDLKPYPLADKNDRNYFIKGFIDRFDNLENQINIIDYKSKKIDSKIDKKKQEDIETLKDIQLALYILYVSQQYPNKDSYAHLLSFKSKYPYAHFANLSTDKDTDAVHYCNEYRDQLRQVIHETKANIEAGNFSYSNIDEKACGYCDYKFICHESVLVKENQNYKVKE